MCTVSATLNGHAFVANNRICGMTLQTMHPPGLASWADPGCRSLADPVRISLVAFLVHPAVLILVARRLRALVRGLLVYSSSSPPGGHDPLVLDSYADGLADVLVEEVTSREGGAGMP
jgi:hypothetical protein